MLCDSLTTKLHCLEISSIVGPTKLWICKYVLMYSRHCIVTEYRHCFVVCKTGCHLACVFSYCVPLCGILCLFACSTVHCYLYRCAFIKKYALEHWQTVVHSMKHILWNYSISYQLELLFTPINCMLMCISVAESFRLPPSGCEMSCLIMSSQHHQLLVS